MKEIQEDIKREFKVDRSDWKPVKFGQVSIQKKENVDREDTNLTWYVKGEHMETEDLHIRQWGELADEYLGPAFIRKFNKGDILYGSRRTYLRKVAIAHFDGITSNTTFVVNANEKLILKELLPFVMLSEGFAQHSIKNSKGSVNPYINWKDIANYEFLLPPKDQQARLVELLWAADEIAESQLKLRLCMDKLFVSVRENSITKADFPKVTLEEICDQLITYGIVQPGPEIEDGMPYIQSSDIKNGEVSKDLSKTSWTIAKSYERSEVKPGDLLFSLRGNLGDTAIVPTWLESSNLARGVARISVSNSYYNQYVQFALETFPIAKGLVSVSQGSTFKEISLNALRTVRIPIPNDLKIQMKISDKLLAITKVKKDTESLIVQSKQLQKSLINQIF